MLEPSFEWDDAKDRVNRAKHGVNFTEAQQAFFDPHRLIFGDRAHSTDEQRYFCLGMIGDRVLTVRFTWRNGRIRIIGAGFWRKGGRLYARLRG